MSVKLHTIKDETWIECELDSTNPEVTEKKLKEEGYKIISCKVIRTAGFFLPGYVRITYLKPF